jgi:hypothetical protein
VLQSPEGVPQRRIHGAMKRSLVGRNFHRTQSINGQTSILTIRGVTATLLLFTSAPLAIAQEISDATAFTATVVNATVKGAKPIVATAGITSASHP